MSILSRNIATVQKKPPSPLVLSMPRLISTNSRAGPPLLAQIESQNSAPAVLLTAVHYAKTCAAFTATLEYALNAATIL